MFLNVKRTLAVRQSRYCCPDPVSRWSKHGDLICRSTRWNLAQGRKARLLGPSADLRWCGPTKNFRPRSWSKQLPATSAAANSERQDSGGRRKLGPVLRRAR
jgi:hypothetical protein